MEGDGGGFYHRDEAGKVEDSCGCIFCDMDLEPELFAGKRVHYVKRYERRVPCSNPKYS